MSLAAAPTSLHPLQLHVLSLAAIHPFCVRPLRCYPSSTRRPALFLPGLSLPIPITRKATPTDNEGVSLFHTPVTSEPLRSIRTLLGSFQKLKMLADSSESVGADVKIRMDSALERVEILAETAAKETAKSCNEEDCASFLANIKILHQEYDSLQNIIRIATGGADESVEGVMPSGVGDDYGDISLAQGSDNGSTVEVLTGPTYVMSIPCNEGSSSQLSSVRAEIERRVTEQLIKARFHQHRSSSNSEKIDGLSNAAIEDVMGTIASEDSILRDPILSKDENLYSIYDFQQLEARLKKLEMEKERSISVELHEKVINRIDNALFETDQRLHRISEELKQKDVILLSFQENLMHQQNELSKKVNQLRDEITCMFSEEQINVTVNRALHGMEQELKDMQNQILHLGMKFEKRETAFVVFKEEQDRIEQLFNNVLEELKCKLHHVDKIQHLNAQSSLLDSINTFREEQTKKNSEIEKELEKIKQIEDVIQVQDRKLYELAEEIGRRVNVKELDSKLKQSLNEMMEEVKQSRNSIDYLVQKLERDEYVTAQLQEEWKAFKKEHVTRFNVWMTRISSLERMHKELQLERFIVEFRNMKTGLTLLQEKQKFESALIVEMQNQMDFLERKGIFIMKNLEDQVAMLKKELLDDVSVLLTKSQKLRNEAQNTQQHYGDAVDEYHMNVDKSSTCFKETVTLQMYDQRRAYLEKFFAIMGHLISREIQKINASSKEQGSPKHLQGILSAIASEEAFSEGGGMNGITLYYLTDWNKAFLHYCPDNTQWTKVPGVPMEDLKSVGEVFKVLKIAAARVEFVLTDGEGNWDQCPDGCNYKLEGPGVYKLAAGVLNLISRS